MKRSCISYAAISVPACLSSPALGEAGVTSGRIVFGQVAAIDGPAGSLGREMRDGIVAAFEEANRSGGVKGRKLEPGFVSLEGYIAGRLTIAALEKEQGEPARRDFLATIFSNSFDLGGVKLSFGPANNQGSAEVFLTILQADGTFKSTASLGLKRSPSTLQKQRGG